MKKSKRASAAKAKTGRKVSTRRAKAVAKRPLRQAGRPAPAAVDPGSRSKATIRLLRSKLKAAERKIAELEAAADTDFLLQVPNRRGFERELARAIAYMTRYRASGALVVLDVDRLKPINDSFGHAAGDEVLKGIVGTLKRQIRASDVLGRLGGDEFALLLWNLSETDAKAKAAVFEQAIDDLAFTFRGQQVTAGASAGVALLGPHSDPAHALDEADAAMYVRKAQRRHEPRIRLVGS